MSDIPRIYAQPWADYELLDAGGGKKFEQGGITPSTIAATRDIQGMITQREMTQALANAINTQKVIVSEADITNSQFNELIIEKAFMSKSTFFNFISLPT